MRPFETSERGVGGVPGVMEAAKSCVASSQWAGNYLQASEAFCALVRSPGSQQIGQEQRPAAKRISPRRAEPQLCNSLGSRR